MFGGGMEMPFVKKLLGKFKKPESVIQEPQKTLLHCDNCPAMFLTLSSARETYGLETVAESRIWYHDQYKRAVMFATGLVIVVALALTLNIIQYSTRPSPQYLGLTSDLRVVKLTPTNKAHITQEKLLNWISETICRTFTLDFLNYRQTFMDVRPNYSKGAYESIYKSMEETGNLDLIIKKRLVTHASLDGTPVIVKEGIVKDHLLWKIEIPFIITYESSNGIEASQKLIGEIIVRREDERQVPRGVLIYQAIMKNR